MSRLGTSHEQENWYKDKRFLRNEGTDYEVDHLYYSSYKSTIKVQHCGFFWFLECEHILGPAVPACNTLEPCPEGPFLQRRRALPIQDKAATAGKEEKEVGPFDFIL